MMRKIIYNKNNNKYILLLICILHSYLTYTQQLTPYQGSRIFWDLNSQTTIFASGNYARMVQLHDKRLLAVAEAQGGICVSYSSNGGLLWTTPTKIISAPDLFLYAVPDISQLNDGTILIAFNPRPLSPYTQDRKFGIRVVRSIDNGATWSDPIFVFDAQYTFDNGCWEPSLLELPSGEVQCYFANENEYTTSNDQNISVSRSFDKGLTWSVPTIVSYRSGYRDGMPVPILLKDRSEIVVIIEDAGWSGRNNFCATTVRNSLTDNWYNGYVNGSSANRSMIFQTIPPSNQFSGACYLRQLPSGETVASFQSNENRINDDLQYSDMHVLVGDENALNFKAKSTPFNVSANMHSIWNSVAVIDTGIIVALGSIGLPNQSNNIYMIKGYPIKQTKAIYCPIKIDGIHSADENWTASNMSQLLFGTVCKNKTSVDFAYDDQNLYLTARVVDRDIIDNLTDDDGVTFMIDANNVSGSTPQDGMYSFFFDVNGTVKMKRAYAGQWTTSPNTNSIQYAIIKKSSYYNLEAAIPWSLLSKSGPVLSNRMAMAFEVVQRSTVSRITEGIADVNNDASSTWLEFKLIPKQINAGSEQITFKKKTTAIVKNGCIKIDSDDLLKQIMIYSIDGKLVYKNQLSGYNSTFSFNGNGIYFLNVELNTNEKIIIKLIVKSSSR